MSMLKEFKEFAVKGNVVDLAVGVVIGGAFGKIVTSFVEDIIMPLVGLATGGMDFSNNFIVLKEGAKAAGPYESLKAAKDAGANVVAWGNLVTIAFNFMIVAFAIFMVVKAINKLKREEKKEEAPAPTGPSEVELLTEIRDALKAK
jgi:large conductance mechanosensitive channel